MIMNLSLEIKLMNIIKIVELVYCVKILLNIQININQQKLLMMNWKNLLTKKTLNIMKIIIN